MANHDTNPYGAAPIAVAHIMLERYQAARAQNPALKDDMSLLKLLKMVYVAHGYHLAICGTPLIRGPIEAWEYGPVIRQIFSTTKLLLGKTGARPLPPTLFARLLSALSPVDAIVTERSEGIISAVINKFGKYSANELSSASHSADSPWCEFYQEGRRNLMDNKTIQAFYDKRRKATGGVPMGL